MPGGDERPARAVGRSGGLPSLPEDVEWPVGGGPFALTVDCAALLFTLNLAAGTRADITAGCWEKLEWAQQC